MAEVRIPTEQIPVDILKRLQDIVDRKTLIGSLCRGPGLTSMAAPSQLLPSSACPSSTSTHPSSLNGTSNMSLFGSSQSPSHGKGSSGTVFSMANIASAASSVPCLFASAASHYTCATSSARLPTFRTLITSTGGDMVDGGSCDPLTQLSGPSPRKRRLVDVLDDSGIVRVFPMEDNLKTTEVEERKSTSEKDSEIVRIFPDMDANTGLVQDSTIVRALTPVHITPRPGSVNMFDNGRELPPRKEWNFNPSHDNASQSTQMPISPRLVLEPCDTTSRRSSRPFSVHCESTNKQSIISNVHKPDSVSSQSLSCKQSPQVKQHPHEADASSNMRNFSSCSGNARRSPDLPTPPQTPDDGDADVGDDEVFTFTSMGGENKYSSQTCGQATRTRTESTPRRRREQSRHHSDRTDGTFQPMAQMASSFGPTQQMSELSFGNREKSRKRLSFDEGMSTQLPNTNQHSYNELSLLPQCPLQAPNSVCSNNSLAGRSGHAGANNSFSPLPKCRSHQSPFPQCPLSQSSSQPHQPLATTTQTPATQINQHPSLSSSPFRPSSRRSPVQDVFAVLEKAVHKQTSAPPRRSRLHSDSDYIAEAHSQGLSTCDRTSSQLASVRRQTFSFGNRKHTDVQNNDETRNEDYRSSPTQTWPREQKSCSGDDCYCSKISRNFLQMVEQAYTGISQMDGTQASFVRFRQELTQTNDILRESLNIFHNIRAMCHHNVRSLSDFSATQAQ